MTHGQGWQFIQIGRFVERAMATARLLDVEFLALNQEKYGETSASSQLAQICLLKSCTAFEAYTKVYTDNLQPRRVAEFLLLNTEFPHAIGFAIRATQTALDEIAATTDTHKGARVYRLAGRLRAMLETTCASPAATSVAISTTARRSVLPPTQPMPGWKFSYRSWAG